MTEYIYIASNHPLTTGSIDAQGLPCHQHSLSNADCIVYTSNNNKDRSPKKLFFFEKNGNFEFKENKEYFFFTNNFDEEDNSYFSFIHYLLHFNYQVCARFIFPTINKKNDSEAMLPLFNYVQNHFKFTNAQTITLLFALNSYENEPLSKKIELSLNKLSPKELMYREMKLITVHK